MPYLNAEGPISGTGRGTGFGRGGCVPARPSCRMPIPSLGRGFGWGWRSYFGPQSPLQPRNTEYVAQLTKEEKDQYKKYLENELDRLKNDE